MIIAGREQEHVAVVRSLVYLKNPQSLVPWRQSERIVDQTQSD